MLESTTVTIGLDGDATSGPIDGLVRADREGFACDP